VLNAQELLLILAVAGVGVLHTMVPDHWAPIALLARQRGWSKAETARAALQAGTGHVVTTLLFGVVVWIVGAAAAQSFGRIVDTLASAALIGFGLWIAVGSWRELRAGSHGDDDDDHGHSHDHEHHPHSHPWDKDSLYSPMRGVPVAARHVHLHRHDSAAHTHWHEHASDTAHVVTADVALLPPLHVHRHQTTGRTALLLVLGSSPMVEGIPVFFAASRYGTGVIAAMSLAFAVSTIATYVFLCVYSASGLQRLNLGPLERYGEVINGAFIALIGLVFGWWSLV
jgi:ABC-type nickel/cobalt efflux system permease component RcnA